MSDPDRPIHEAKLKELAKAKRFLAKHFASVRIVCTYEDADIDHTELVSTGHGDYYAQVGATKAWIAKHDGYLHGIAAAEAREDMDDEDDTGGDF